MTATFFYSLDCRAAILIFLLALGVACMKQEDSALQKEPGQAPEEACPLLSSDEIEGAPNPAIGNWRWIRTRRYVDGAVLKPQTEGYEECWVIANDSISICRYGMLEFRIPAEIRYGPHPFAKFLDVERDSTYLFFNTGIMTFYGDTLEIYDSYVDGNDYWLVRK